MEELIKQAFLHVDVIGPHVQEGHYDLIGPNGEIILPSVWEKVVQPDWAITMHMWPMDKAPLRGIHPGMMQGGHHIPGRPGAHAAHGHPAAHGRPMMAGGAFGMRPQNMRPGGGGAPGQQGPPMPPGWTGRPHPSPGGEGRGGPGRPLVVEVEPRKRSSKSGTSVLGWMAGKSSKGSSSKKSVTYA